MISSLAQSTSQGGNPLGFLILLLPVALLYFMFRSQKRRAVQQQSLQQAAHVGDEILTTSGIFGTIVDEDEDEGTVVVEIAPGTKITMVRAGISRRVTEDETDDEDEDTQDTQEDDHQAEGPIGS
jgi:preprotein translocase subunit YajC